MRIYISDKYKHVIMAPCKTGSCTVDGLFRAQVNWDSIYLGKPIENPKTLLFNYMTPELLRHFTVILFIRNPVDWIISGFRYMQNEANQTANYPRSLLDHLIAMKHKSVEDEFWLAHCYRQPAYFYNKEFKIQKLEEFSEFLKHLKNNCKSEYRRNSSYVANKNTTVPYPKIGIEEEKLLIKLTTKTAKIGNYNVLETIEKYKRKQFKDEK